MNIGGHCLAFGRPETGTYQTGISKAFNILRSPAEQAHVSINRDILTGDLKLTKEKTITLGYKLVSKLNGAQGEVDPANFEKVGLEAAKLLNQLAVEMPSGDTKTTLIATINENLLERGVPSYLIKTSLKAFQKIDPSILRTTYTLSDSSIKEVADTLVTTLNGGFEVVNPKDLTILARQMIELVDILEKKWPRTNPNKDTFIKAILANLTNRVGRAALLSTLTSFQENIDLKKSVLERQKIKVLNVTGPPLKIGLISTAASFVCCFLFPPAVPFLLGIGSVLILGCIGYDIKAGCPISRNIKNLNKQRTQLNSLIPQLPH
jgi:hypothetical protein